MPPALPIIEFASLIKFKICYLKEKGVCCTNTLLGKKPFAFPNLGKTTLAHLPTRVYRKQKTNDMIIAVTNLKGGVGKSTIARNLAAYFVKRGVKTCIVDTDLEQRTTCDWQERREGTETRIPVFPMTTVQALPKDIETHSADGYQIIIIDGVPQMDQVATRTMLICDILLIPITPSIDDLKSFERFLARFEEVKIHRENIPAFLVLNKFSVRSNEDKEVRAALKLFEEVGITPLKSTLGDRVAHRRASKYGLTAFEWEDERAKDEVVQLCKELEAIFKALNPNRSNHDKLKKKINR